MYKYLARIVIESDKKNTKKVGVKLKEISKFLKEKQNVEIKDLYLEYKLKDYFVLEITTETYILMVLLEKHILQKIESKENINISVTRCTIKERKPNNAL